MSLPKDKFMLLSYVNTLLRDNYSSLDELCAVLGEDKEVMIESLAEIGYTYFREANTFK